MHYARTSSHTYVKIHQLNLPRAVKAAQTHTSRTSSADPGWRAMAVSGRRYSGRWAATSVACLSLGRTAQPRKTMTGIDCKEVCPTQRNGWKECWVVVSGVAIARRTPVSLRCSHSAASWVMPYINSPAGLKLSRHAPLPYAPLVPYGTL
mgnify:CR=1 FL=1